jgi:hypothetical protein
MKFCIVFLSLFALLAFIPIPVCAVTHVYTPTRTPLDFEPKTAEPRPKWVKIIERILPFSMAVGFIFAQSSLGSKGFGTTQIVRPTNLIIGATLLILTFIIALTLFIHRMIKVFKNPKRT